jgi:anti-sigma B factor antagonist
MEEGIGVPQGLTVLVERNGGRADLVLSGELDLASAEALAEELHAVEGERPEVIALDLRRLSFLDSTGLAFAVRAHTRARREGRQLVIIPGPPQVQKVFALTGLDRVLEFEDGPQPRDMEEGRTERAS